MLKDQEKHIIKNMLINARKKAGLSLREVAKDCNIDHTYLYRFEKGLFPKNNQAILISCLNYYGYDLAFDKIFNQELDHLFDKLNNCYIEMNRVSVAKLDLDLRLLEPKIKRSLKYHKFLLYTYINKFYLHDGNGILVNEVRTLLNNVDLYEPEDQLLLYDHVAIYYQLRHDHDKAIDLFNKALAIDDTSLQSAVVGYHMVRSLVYRDRCLQAHRILAHSIEIFRDKKIDIREMLASSRIGNICQHTRQYKEAVNYIKEMYRLACKNKEIKYIKLSLYNLMVCFCESHEHQRVLGLFKFVSFKKLTMDHKFYCIILCHALESRDNELFEKAYEADSKLEDHDDLYYKLNRLMNDIYLNKELSLCVAEFKTILALTNDQEFNYEKHVVYKIMALAYANHHEYKDAFEALLMAESFHKD